MISGKAQKQSIVISRSGSVNVLKVINEKIVPPQKHEVVINVSYIGINFADIAMRKGLYAPAPRPPFVPGFEVAGTIAAVGSDIKNFAIGNRVLAATKFGGYTTQLTTNGANVRRINDHIPLAVAAAFPAAYTTAWLALTEVARARSGEIVLIHAVAGGFGLAALQIAKHLGLTVIGTASTEEKLNFAKNHKLDHGINYSETDFVAQVSNLSHGRGIDICLDSVGTTLRKSYQTLGTGGRLVIIGAADIVPRSILYTLDSLKKFISLPRFKVFDLLESNRSVMGLPLLNWWNSKGNLGETFDTLIDLLHTGVLTPVIDKEFSFYEVASAHKYMEARKTKGKIILKVNLSNLSSFAE